MGVGVGLAVNGTLSNFAGGVMLLFTRPFRDGDFIAANGYEGTVEDIFICNTKIRTYDNKVVYLPNGKLSTSEIVNYTEKDVRRVDLMYSISYSDDFDKAADVVKKVASENPKILKDPAPKARVTKHSASSIDLFCPVWCKTDDYWDVLFDMNEAVKKAFDENGISIPFTQMDVHVKND
ncbi:MAG: mechanosensitive ion channel family protein [Christensenellales bacterium]